MNNTPLTSQEAALVVVDIQGKLARMVANSDQMIARAAATIRICQALDIPVLWAEQVPEKLGATVPEISDCLSSQRPIAKDSFGCLGNDEFDRSLRKINRHQIIVCGIETHVCVLQTVTALRAQQYGVQLVADACSARGETDHKLALHRMRESGSTITTVETLAFEIMHDVGHPAFRTISGLLKQMNQA